MLLSRFWYIVLALALGGAVFILFVAAQLYNRSGQRAMADDRSDDFWASVAATVKLRCRAAASKARNPLSDGNRPVIGVSPNS